MSMSFLQLISHSNKTKPSIVIVPVIKYWFSNLNLWFSDFLISINYFLTSPLKNTVGTCDRGRCNLWWSELVSLLLDEEPEQKPGGILIWLQEYVHTYPYAHERTHTHTRASCNYKQVQLTQTPPISIVVHFMHIFYAFPPDKLGIPIQA